MTGQTNDTALAARRLLIERVKAADAKIIAEHKSDMLLTEALDPKKLQSVMQIVTKLRSVDFGAVPSVDKQIDNAVGRLNKMLAKGKASTKERAVEFMGKIMKAAAQRNMSVFQTPIGKAMALATAIETGFKDVQQLIASNVKQGALEGASDKTLKDLTGDNAKNVEKALVQAFTSKKSQGVLDPKLAAADIMNAKLGALAKITQAVGTGEMTNLVDNVMGSLTGNKPAETGTQAATPPTGTKSGTESGTEPGAAASGKQGTEAAPEKSGNHLSAADLAKMAGVTPDAVRKVAAALHKMGYDLTKRPEGAKIA